MFPGSLASFRSSSVSPFRPSSVSRAYSMKWSGVVATRAPLSRSGPSPPFPSRNPGRATNADPTQAPGSKWSLSATKRRVAPRAMALKSAIFSTPATTSRSPRISDGVASALLTRGISSTSRPWARKYPSSRAIAKGAKVRNRRESTLRRTGADRAAEACGGAARPGARATRRSATSGTSDRAREDRLMEPAIWRTRPGAGAAAAGDRRRRPAAARACARRSRRRRTRGRGGSRRRQTPPAPS